MKSENICSLKPLEFAFLLMLNATKFTIYTPTVLPIVFNARKTWSVALRTNTGYGYSRMGRRETYLDFRGRSKGRWTKLHNRELRELYSLPNIIRMVKSRRMRWAGHVARMGGEERHIQGFGGGTCGTENTWKT